MSCKIYKITFIAGLLILTCNKEKYYEKIQYGNEQIKSLSFVCINSGIDFVLFLTDL